MLTYRSSIIFLMLLQQLYCWEVSPSQFLVIQNDGTYKYGYDTGDGIAVKQSGDPANQVSGYYSYKAPLRGDINLKYTSGVQGFMPETLPTTGSQLKNKNENDQSKTGDASYSFSFDTPTYRRTETSDRFGNIKGSYLYIDETGMHDLSFIAGEKTGFVPTSGSLSKPNGLTIDQAARLPLFRTVGSTAESPVTVPTTDLSSTEPVTNTDEESTDETTTESLSESETKAANGKQSKAIKNGFSYKNSVGSHDLRFVSGSGTGFQPIGSSLSAPPGFINSENLQKPTSYFASGLVPVVPVLPTAQTHQPLDYNIVLHSYLPQSNDGTNFGYINDTI